MNLNDAIEHLLLSGINQITIFPAPEGKVIVQAAQPMDIGGKGNHCNVMHQMIGESVVECVEQIRKNSKYCSELKPLILPLKR